ncbi:T9SS type A sorting domain-containing protein [candidate division KSB1 bacterium]|nr:T9SS type A sorting domain-containing protein [candidate division KSB1 bacterium]
MRRVLWTIVGLLSLINSSAYADTTWVTSGDVTGLWISPQSPYVITGDVSVPSGGTLIIGPGVTVSFAGQYHFNVRGALRALGVAEDSIRFTTDTLANPARWQGLRFVSAHNSSELNYCVIENGKAILEGADRAGGGIDMQTTTMTIRRTTFRRCQAAVDGGAIHVREGSNPLLEDCVIERCTAGQGGGALLIRNSSGVIRRTVMRDNRSALYGGALFVRNDSYLVLEDCRIERNIAVFDGGAVCGSHSGSNIVARRCYVANNQAGSRGGGVFGRDWRMTFENCVFDSNSADSGGCCNTVVSAGRYARFYHCTLSGNAAAVGGAIWCNRGPIELINSIVAGTTGGAALEINPISPDSASVRACAYWNNTLGDVGGIPFSEHFGVVDSLNANDYPCDRLGNIFADPQFMDSLTGNYRLRDTSPCIGAALGGILAEDIQQVERPFPEFTMPDIGAFESEIGGTHHFLCGPVAGLIGPGDVTAGCDLVINAGDSLTIAPGTRMLFPPGAKLSVLGTLLAEGTETDSIYFTRSQPTDTSGWFGVRMLSLDGLRTSRMRYCVVEYGGASGNPASRGGGLEVANSAALEISHCELRYNAAVLYGGGMAIDGSASVVMQYCRFLLNRAANPGGQGGGLFVGSSDAQFVSDCVFDSNMSASNGGGVYFQSSGSEFLNCRIIGNSSRSGAGLHLAADDCRVYGCTFQLNRASSEGGGIVAYFRSEFDSCWITENAAETRGGGVAMYGAGGHPVFSRCLIAHNQSGFGGGVYAWLGGDLERCTVVDNTGSSGGGIYSTGSGLVMNSTVVSRSVGVGIYFAPDVDSVEFMYCDTYGNSDSDLGGPGNPPEFPPDLGMIATLNARGDSCDIYSNVSLDPWFEDAENRDYHVQALSPCIDAGSPELAPDPDGSLADIGAFFTTSPFSTPEPFALTAPGAGDTLRDSVVFSWEAAVDPDTGESIWYELEFAALDTFAQAWEVLVTHDAGQLTQRAVNIDSLPRRERAAYYWYVLAHSHYPRYTTRSAETRRYYPWNYASPPPFNLLAPDAGDTLRGLTEFSWETAVDPDTGEVIWYEVEFAALDTIQQTWQTLATYFTGPSTSRWIDIDSLPRVDHATTHWYALAHTQLPEATTRSAQIRQFYPWRYTPPAPFNLISPADEDTLQLPAQRFCWHSTTDRDPGDTVRYRLVVTVEDSVTHQVTELRSLDTGTDTCVTATFDSLEHGRWTHLDWHATARSSQPQGEVFSAETRQLVWIMGPPRSLPRPFHLTAPPSGATLGGLVEFRWQATVDPDSGEHITFDLQFLSYDSLTQELDTVATLAAGPFTHFTTNVNVLDQREHVSYYWHVLANSLYPPLAVRSIEQDPFVLDTTQATANRTTELPREFALRAIYPNPFNSSTTISFDLPRPSAVSMRVYDVTGRATATLIESPLEAGSHRLTFDAHGLAAGVYFVSLQAEGYSATRKLLLLK